MRRTALILLASTALTATAAAAETVYTYGDLGVTHVDAGAGDHANFYAFDAGFEATRGALTYGVDVTASDVVAGGNEDKAASFAGHIGYDLTPNFTAALDITRSFDNGHSTDVALGGEYRLNDYTLGYYASQSSSDDWDTITNMAFAHVEKENYDASLALLETGGDKMVAAMASHSSAKYEGDFGLLRSVSDNLTIAKADLKYNLVPGYRALGGVTGYSVQGNHAYTLSAGAGKEIVPNLWADLEVGQVRAGGDKVMNAVSLGMTYELGARKLKARKVATDIADMTWMPFN